ncbi:MAG: protease modulator HflC [Pseudomonadota bacterium]
MQNKLALIIGILLVVLGVALFMSLYTVRETQQVLVLQFGEIKRTVTEPGLKLKWPWQNVVIYDKRILNLDPPTEQVILSDQNRLLVDAFARYRITNPVEFYKSVREESVLRARLGQIINAAVRGILGNVTLSSVLSDDRVNIMAQIRDQVNRNAENFGIRVVDLRIGRADLPDQTRESVYDRMKSEREREAAEFRAQGFEQAQRIRATADRESTVIKAEAEREADILRGEGEGKRTTILNDAYGQDSGFFDFYRSMQAYEKSLANDSTYMVLSPQSEFFNFFDNTSPRDTAAPTEGSGTAQ